MDPRVAARRTAVTREQGRRRLRVLAVLAGGTALLVGLWLVAFHSPLFAARAITVVGAVNETPAEVVQASGLASHPPLLSLNTGAVARAVERMPWVRGATVSVHWPDGVRIVVHEETPRLAVAVAGGQWAEVASDGRVLTVTAARPAGLLTFVGAGAGAAAAGGAGGAAPAAVTLTPGMTLGPQDAAGLAVASTLPPSFVAQVTGVTVESGGWVQLTMTTPILVDIGNATQLPAKYEDVSALLAGATLHTGDVIDVSVPQAPTVTGG
jgi:hypothetical protein